MKKNVIIVALMLGTISLMASACSVNPPNKSIEKDSLNDVEVVRDTPTDVNEVVFQKGKLIEVAFLSIKEGKARQLKEVYFPKVMPIVQEYGGKPLMKVGIKNAWSKDIKPQMIVFFEWPSAAKKEAFERDPRFIEIKKIRTEALSFLKLSFFKVEKDRSVHLDESKFYEIYGMSLKADKGHLMQQYFEKAGPICTNEYDVDFALSMSPVKVNISGHEHYKPQTFGLAIWPNEEVNKRYFDSKAYAEIKHFKEAALKQMDAWQGAVILN